MSIASENRAFFTTYDPLLLTELEGVEPARVEPARKEGMTLKVGGKYVHSKYHPPKEARSVADKVKTPPQKLHVHFGFGLGHFLEADPPASGGTVLIFEPEPAMAAAALEHVALGPLFKSRKARLFCVPRRFREALRNHMERDVAIRVIMSPFHEKNYVEQAAEFVESLKRERSRQGMMGEERTREMFRIFLESTLCSLKYVTRLPGVERLRDKFQGKPGVVVVAGPSLEKNIHELIPYKDRALIFSVSRAVRALENVGIAPHFLIQTEAKDFHFLIDGCRSLEQSTFLLADQCHEHYYRHPSRYKFTYQNPGNMVSAWLNDHFPSMQKQFLATAGSVATEAFSLAMVLGCDPIILVGQDLAITGERYYVRSNANQRPPYLSQDRRRTRGYFGGMVESLANYLHFISWYEDAVEVYRERYPNRRFINATEGGARLNGFENMKLRDVLWQFCQEPVDPEPVLSAAAEMDAKSSLPPKHLQRFLKNGLKTIRDAQSLCRRFEGFKKVFQKALTTVDTHNAHQLSKHLKEMRGYNQAFLKLYGDLKILAGFGEGELQSLQSGSGGSDNLESLTAELGQDLERMALNFQITGIAARRLKHILSALI